MKPETIEKIRAILRDDMAIKRLAMMRAIEGDEPHDRVESTIAEYKKAHAAFIDFCDWAMENEED